nr:immunoglobulin heavy chain junction region [Macaca mulatta]
CARDSMRTYWGDSHGGDSLDVW